jgi:hypothetical protein
MNPPGGGPFPGVPGLVREARPYGFPRGLMLPESAQQYSRYGSAPEEMRKDYLFGPAAASCSGASIKFHPVGLGIARKFAAPARRPDFGAEPD